jgi:lipopolysaccharide transport system ATP-binding protein
VLNGAILGMSRKEIMGKFDEIVAFAEVERFIDTPVKHYSSGMYVRLAFAVAAHLETEILIVDEVLAVGDAAFQKKCLAKMEDAAGHGRTVLVVSHNTASMRALCTRGVVLQAGQIVADTGIADAIDFYLNSDATGEASITWSDMDAPRCEGIKLRRAQVLDDTGRAVEVIVVGRKFSITLEYEVLRPVTGLRTGFMLQDFQGVTICGSTDYGAWSGETQLPGIYVSRCQFPNRLLNVGRFRVMFGIEIYPFHSVLVRTPYCLTFDIEDLEGHGPRHQRLPGVVRPDLNWSVTLRQEVSAA